MSTSSVYVFWLCIDVLFADTLVPDEIISYADTGSIHYSGYLNYIGTDATESTAWPVSGLSEYVCWSELWFVMTVGTFHSTIQQHQYQSLVPADDAKIHTFVDWVDLGLAIHLCNCWYLLF